MISKARHAIYRLLRASERYTKTDMLYLAKGGSWLSLGHGIAVATGFGVAVALANLIPPEVFGTYKFVLSLAGIITAFSLTGLSTAIIRSVANGHEGSLRSGFKTSLVWSTGTILIAFAGAGYYFVNDDVVLAISMLLVGIFSPLMGAGSLYNSFLAGKHQFRTQTLYNTGRITFPALVLVGTLFLTDNPIAILATYFISNTIITLLYYQRTLSQCNPKNLQDPKLANYSKHLSIMNIVGIIGHNIDKILIFHFLGAAPLALYAFAIAPVDQLRSGGKILQNLVLAKLSSRSFTELQQSMPRKALVSSLFFGILAMAYIILSPLLYTSLFPQYINAVVYSQVYAITLLFMPAVLFMQMLIAHEKKRELYISKFVTPIFKIALFSILLPLYGIMGLIVALVLANFFNMLLLFLLSIRVTPNM